MPPHGRPIKALSMCDELTRENVARRLGRSITADDVTHTLDEASAVRGALECIRCDNGPEFVAIAIRDWCRAHGTATSYIEPGSPWQNPYVESFNSRLRDELFAREHDHGSADPLRRLVRLLQSPSAAQLARLPAARGLCRAVQKPGTLIEGGPANGVRSRSTHLRGRRRFLRLLLHRISLQIFYMRQGNRVVLTRRLYGSMTFATWGFYGQKGVVARGEERFGFPGRTVRIRAFSDCVPGLYAAVAEVGQTQRSAEFETDCEGNPRPQTGPVSEPVSPWVWGGLVLAAPFVIGLGLIGGNKLAPA